MYTVRVQYGITLAFNLSIHRTLFRSVGFNMAPFYSAIARRLFLQQRQQHWYLSFRQQYKGISTVLTSSSSSSFASFPSSSVIDHLCLDPRGRRKRRNPSSSHFLLQHGVLTTIHNKNQQKRTYLPLIPALIVGTLALGGWIAYRKSYGRPVAPDQALEAQEAYRKEQERLKKQQQQYKKNEKK